MNREARRIKWAKLADNYLGALLVYLAAMLLPRRPSHQAQVRKILFIKFWGIGSIVLSEPSLRWLKSRYPKAELHYLTLERNRALFTLIPAIETLHTLTFGGVWSFFLETSRLLGRLRREDYDLVFDAEFFVNFSGLVAHLSAPAQVVGFARETAPKTRLQDVSIPFHEDAHSCQQFLNLVRQGGGKGQSRSLRPRLALDESSGSFLQTLLEGRTYIVMNINASPLAVERRWPRERFVQLGRALLESYPFDLVLIGSPSEASYVAPLAQALERGHSSGRVWNWAGLLDLKQLARLLKDSLALISNDSGPIHLASAFDVPVMGFYGPETPVRYGPLSSRRRVLYEDLWCSPCMSVHNAKTVHCVNQLACMKGIKTEKAIEEMRAFIDTELLVRPILLPQTLRVLEQ